jgi:hypothetical protein
MIYAMSKVGGKIASCEVTVSAGLEAGLYKNDEKVPDAELTAGANLLVKSFAWIKEKETLDGDEYKIVLDADITVSTGFSIGTGPSNSSTGTADKNKNITITLQGLTTTKTITMNVQGALFTVYGKSGDVPELIVGENITLQGSSTNNSPLVMIGNGTNNIGKLTMLAGSRITGNTNTNQAGSGGVNVAQGSTFNMEGGSIDRNQATVNGGGVYNGGTFNMTGGIIENNIAATKFGGGVYDNNGEFIMSGGAISDNKAPGRNSYGGGVVASKFTMSGTALITRNEANSGGGVMVNSTNNSNFFTMNGGTISGNRANKLGAAVIAFPTSTGPFIKTGGIIYGIDENDEEKANKKAAGVTVTVHAIEMSGVGYYDATADENVSLDSSVADNWSK